MVKGSLDYLLPAAKAGDKEELDKLCRELKSYLNFIYKDKHYNFHGYDKHDFTQDTILTVLENLNKIDGGIKKYACTIYKNKVGDKLRQAYGVRSIPSGDIKIQPVVTYLTINDVHNSHLEIIEKAHYESLLESMCQLKEICRIYFTALYEDWMDKLHDIYKHMYPGNSKSAYYTQLTRCRNSIKLIIKDERLI